MPSRRATAISPELMLQKATEAPNRTLRAKYARLGLGQGPRLNRTTRALLLRQLYLAHMEGRSFREALRVAEQMVELDVLPDVARQDAARACLGLGDWELAVQHLRLASRSSPPSRRAFHLWTLGSVLYWSGRTREAAGVLERAVRWGTTARPLYQAQLALVRLELGERVENLSEIRERLAESASSRGYGQFLLAELSYRMGDYAAALAALEGFLKRVTGGRVALEVALASEIARARFLLRKLRTRRSPRPPPAGR